MSLIRELTIKQNKQLIKHRKEYLEWGLCTDPINISLMKESISNVYKWHLNKKIKYFWVCDSPLMCNLIISMLRDGELFQKHLWQNLEQNLEQNLGQNLWQNLEQNFEQNLRQNLGQNLWQNLWQNLRQNLWQNLGQNLGQNLEQNLRQNLEQNLRQNLDKKIYTTCFLWGQQDMYWIAHYQYPAKYLNIDYGKYQKGLDFWDAIGRSCNWWYPFEDIVFVSDRPKEIYKNEQGQLHKDGKPAILFRDGYCLWMLNGVECGEKIVQTPAQELSVKLITEEKNVQVRAEIIKKIGYSRILKELKAKHLDTWREYELYQMDVNDVEPLNLLKFSCPSTGVYYSLRAPSKIVKAREAIKWCNHGTDSEEFLVET